MQASPAFQSFTFQPPVLSLIFSYNQNPLIRPTFDTFQPLKHCIFVAFFYIIQESKYLKISLYAFNLFYLARALAADYSVLIIFFDCQNAILKKKLLKETGFHFSTGLQPCSFP